MVTDMITKVAEEPQGSRHSKWLHKEKAVPPPKAVCETAYKVAHEHMPTHTINRSMCPWCSDAPEHPQYPLGMMQAIKHNQHHPWHHAMDNNIATTRLLHLLHTGPGLDSNKHTPLKGCASTSVDHQEPPSAFWTVLWSLVPKWLWNSSESWFSQKPRNSEFILFPEQPQKLKKFGFLDSLETWKPSHSWTTLEPFGNLVSLASQIPWKLRNPKLRN